MNRVEHLLTIMNEEAAEVAKEGSKCLRFGPTEVYPEIGISNAMRVMREYYDLKAVVIMLQREGVLPRIDKATSTDWMQAKTEKVEKHLLYSGECGTLQT